MITGEKKRKLLQQQNRERDTHTHTLNESHWIFKWLLKPNFDKTIRKEDKSVKAAMLF